MKIVTAAEMRNIDRRASDEYGVPSLILMENAGIRVVEVAETYLENRPPGRVVVVAGKGNNGGDGLVAVRHRINTGGRVETFLLGDPEEMTPDTLVNYEILKKMGALMFPLKDEEGINRLIASTTAADLIIDALYGISFRGKLR